MDFKRTIKLIELYLKYATKDDACCIINIQTWIVARLMGSKCNRLCQWNNTYLVQVFLFDRLWAPENEKRKERANSTVRDRYWHLEQSNDKKWKISSVIQMSHYRLQWNMMIRAAKIEHTKK